MTSSARRTGPAHPRGRSIAAASGRTELLGGLVRGTGAQNGDWRGTTESKGPGLATGPLPSGWCRQENLVGAVGLEPTAR